MKLFLKKCYRKFYFMQFNTRDIIILLGLCVLVYFPLFGHLDVLPIRIWDEARLAISAIEMHYNGNWLVTHYNGEPDMWNTKPPLMIWCQVLFIKILGINELAIRLPSALAALFTCGLLAAFSYKYFKDIWIGVFAVLVLITADGYVSLHGSRTGDYDVPLAFFTTVSCLSYFTFLYNNKSKYLYLTFLGITLAVLTKSIVGLMFLPGLFLYTLYKRKLSYIFKYKHFYIGVLLSIGIMVLVIGGREFYNPGYLQAVMDNDLGGRFLVKRKMHVGPFLYYLYNWMDYRFSYWIILLPVSMVVGWNYKQSAMRDLSLFLTICILSFFLILSSSETKIKWYDIPMYPLIALIIAQFIYFIFTWLKTPPDPNLRLKKNILPYLFVFVLFYFPYQHIFTKTNPPNETHRDGVGFYNISYFLKSGYEGKINLNGHTLLKEGYQPQLTFYFHLLKQKGIDIKLGHWRHPKPGERVIAYQKKMITLLKERFEVKFVHKEKGVEVFDILDIKNQTK